MHDRYGEPVEPDPSEDDTEYTQWWKNWLNHCRDLLGVEHDDR